MKTTNKLTDEDIIKARNILEKKKTKSSLGNEEYKCKKCKDRINEVICSCEVASKYDLDYEDWLIK